jgi:hypothetical protein
MNSYSSSKLSPLATTFSSFGIKKTLNIETSNLNDISKGNLKSTGRLSSMHTTKESSFFKT